jgi:hypothetical protein
LRSERGDRAEQERGQRSGCVPDALAACAIWSAEAQQRHDAGEDERMEATDSA